MRKRCTIDFNPHTALFDLCNMGIRPGYRPSFSSVFKNGRRVRSKVSALHFVHLIGEEAIALIQQFERITCPKLWEQNELMRVLRPPTPGPGGVRPGVGGR